MKEIIHSSLVRSRAEQGRRKARCQSPHEASQDSEPQRHLSCEMRALPSLLRMRELTQGVSRGGGEVLLMVSMGTETYVSQEEQGSGAERELVPEKEQQG
jgi:hypothetical protein